MIRQFLSSTFGVLPAPLKASIRHLRAGADRYIIKTIQSGVGEGLRIYADRARQYVAGANEIPVQEAFAAHIKPGQTFFDIGANVGFFTLLGAKLVSSSGKVFAFEPVPQNAEAIRRNVGLNGFSNVTVMEKAVSRRSGTGDLVLSRHPGGATLTTGDIAPPDMIGIKSVAIVSIDDLISIGEIPPPHVVKIDVEGAEVEVLEGMAETVRKHRPVLIYEIDDLDKQAFTQRFTQFEELVRAHGYEVTRLGKGYPGITVQVGHAVAVPV
jgi:FkbM family methyltransferase